MKTLIINGSPRKNGDTAYLLTEFKKHLKGEIYTVNTYFDNISPCIDCRFCWSNNSCAINDKMQEIYVLLNEVNNVVIASPIYFSQLTGSILSFFSRLQYFYVSRIIRNDMDFKLNNKKGILILTGGGDGSPDPAVKTANTLFHQMNAHLTDCIFSLKTQELPAIYDEISLIKIKETAKKLSGTNS